MAQPLPVDLELLWALRQLQAPVWLGDPHTGALKTASKASMGGAR